MRFVAIYSKNNANVYLKIKYIYIFDRQNIYNGKLEYISTI